MVEVDAAQLFADESKDWEFCKEFATYSHYEACEFILHIGPKDYSDHRIKEMEEFGCSAGLINAYKAARESWATNVLFYA